MRIFKKKKSLRELCKEKYGDDFIELYDKLGTGEPIGNMIETVIFLDMIEEVRRENDEDALGR